MPVAIGDIADLNGREINVMQHALAWPRCYRNRFCIHEGTINFEVWDGLCNKGFAELDLVLDKESKYVQFSVTDLGIATLKAIFK